MSIPSPTYEVVSRDGAIEIRSYAPMLVANTYDKAAHKIALRSGFKRLAGYIFGGNRQALSGKAAHAIPMTAPVRVQAVEQAAGRAWQTQFIMPEAEDLQNIPQPQHQNIELRELPASKMACIRFTGLWREANFRRHAQHLRQWLDTQGLKYHPQAIYCYYNTPWSFPWLRRNEVMFVLES